MGQLRHPHIGQLHGVFIDSLQRPVIIGELLSESLAQRFAFGARYTFRDVMDISAEVLSGLVYLHGLPQPVVHGSLCSANVLFTADGVVKLTDANLALAKLHSPATPPTPASSATNAEVSTIVGTTAEHVHSLNAQLYQPPEALRGDCYDVGVDSFSFSILLMALALHREPRPGPAFAGRHDTLLTVGDGKQSPRTSELERRANDLSELKSSAPLLHSLVSIWIDDSDTVPDALPERPSTTEQLRNVTELRRSEEYTRWPSTRGAPFAQGVRRRQELEIAVRRMEGEVREALVLASRTIDKQKEDFLAQIRELVSLHDTERGRMRRLLEVARRDVQQARSQAAEERRERLLAEQQRESLESQLETLRSNSVSPRPGRKLSMPDDPEREVELRDSEPPSSLLTIKALQLSESAPGLSGSQYLNGGSEDAGDYPVSC